MRPLTLEVIAQSVEDVKAINKSKANRIELCSNLEVGGYTPNIELIKEATEISKIPVMVIVRNHSDNFEINDEQLNQIIKQIKEINKTKAHGIVFGAILNNKVNKKALETIINTVENKEITFHKAFDYVDDKESESSYLHEQGVNRILTSGRKGNPINFLKELKETNESGIEVLIGGGVTIDNKDTLIKNGFKNIHIGRAARKNNSWDCDIDIEKINEFTI
ncbi:copper homeostasis protein CutC [Mycoplasma todarodis]|uniref:copper homeostasis protein CutC n=1 Tax=Mycoplasma todarodis TaxID=1937191 RepID=UPI003B358710